MFAFNFNKSVQAAAYLLRRESCREMNYMRLLKILYIADRESIRQTGRPITGDNVVAMKQGPVLSGILNLIKGAHLQSPEWSRFIQKDEYMARLVDEPGLSNLSRFDIDTLERVAEEHRSNDEWEMVEITHTFPEWKKNDPGSASMKVIPCTDIFEAVGRAIDPELEEETRQDKAFARLFGG